MSGRQFFGMPCASGNSGPSPLMTRGSLRLRHSSAHQARYEFRLTDVVIVVGGQHRPAMGHRAIQPGPRLDGASPGILLTALQWLATRLLHLLVWTEGL